MADTSPLIATFERKIHEFAEKCEFRSFWLGVVLSSKMEEGLSGEECLALKQKIKRSLGMRLEEEWKKEGIRAVHDDPDVLFTLDFHSRRLKVKVKPLLIYGRYRKFSREIPQSKWPCRKCGGRGCDYCGRKGAMYTETVENFLAAPLLKATGGKVTKMHAVGREDIDARMLGSGRPFIIEVVDPLKRSIDLEKIAASANRAAKGKAEYRELSFASQKDLDKILAAQPDKTYLLKVECEKEVAPSILRKIISLKGKTITQKTPVRVLHRRANLTRKRKIKRIDAKMISKNSFELKLTVESGTYVKELVTGDGGRTTPNISQILGCSCKPSQLDVLDVAFELH